MHPFVFYLIGVLVSYGLLSLTKGEDAYKETNTTEIQYEIIVICVSLFSWIYLSLLLVYLIYNLITEKDME